MGRRVSLETSRGRIGGFRADPPMEPRGVVIVVQEIFGLNAHIRQMVDRFAGHGFVAFAPAFFDHIKFGIELDYDEAGVTRGRELTEQVGLNQVIDDIRRCERLLSSEGNVGVVGFCWGGTVALLANTRLGFPCVDYYGARSVPYLHERLRAPAEFHFGELDPLIPPEVVQMHREAYPDSNINLYPAGHGFNCDQRADYHPESAQLAMQRTLAFLIRVLH